MKRLRLALFILIPLTLVVLGFSAIARGGADAAKKKAESDALANRTKVERGNVRVTVVETGSLEAKRTVEVKSQVGGRVAKLLVDAGDRVEKGQLIAIIDPQETRLQVEQNQAQLRGAQSQVKQLEVQIQQRRVTAQTNLAKARLRVQQLDAERKAQPKLTNTNIRSAETALANAQKQREVLVKVTQPNARTQAETAQNDARNNLRIAETEFQRQTGLFQKGYVSRREVESAELNKQLAESRLRQASEALQRIDNELRLEREQADERVKQAQADLDRARANSVQDTTSEKQYQLAVQDVRDAEIALRDVEALLQQRAGSVANVDQIRSVLGDSQRKLNETEVRAPMSGIVTRRFVQEGEIVNAVGAFSAGTTIVSVDDRSVMLVKLQINEIDVARLRLGLEAEISVDALPSEKFAGTVTKIAPAQVVSATGGATADSVVKYDVEVELNEVVDELKAGMSAKCTMTPLRRDNVVRIPKAFLGEDKQGGYVVVFDPKAPKPKPAMPGQAPKDDEIKTRVVVGVQNASHVEIISGLKEGTEIQKPKFTGPDRKGMMQFGPGDGEEEEAKPTDEESGE